MSKKDHREREAKAVFSYSGTELEALRGATYYYRWILSCFLPHVGKRVIEVGAGLGTFSEFILNETGASELFLIEPDSDHISLLTRRYGENPRVKIIQGHLEHRVDFFIVDSVIAVNVLEHVEDDEAFLRCAHKALAQGGTLLLFVPAFPWLYGTLDKVAGHFRRYDKALLRSKLKKAGFRVLDLFYFNFPGIVGWLLAGKVFRLKTLNTLQVQLYDKWVVPWVSRLEKHCKPVLGQSLVAIAEK